MSHFITAAPSSFATVVPEFLLESFPELNPEPVLVKDFLELDPEPVLIKLRALLCCAPAEPRHASVPANLFTSGEITPALLTNPTSPSTRWVAEEGRERPSEEVRWLSMVIKQHRSLDLPYMLVSASSTLKLTIFQGGTSVRLTCWLAARFLPPHPPPRAALSPHVALPMFLSLPRARSLCLCLGACEE